MVFMNRIVENAVKPAVQPRNGAAPAADEAKPVVEAIETAEKKKGRKAKED